MLRTTFHLDGDDPMSRPFMAVHSQDASVQSFEIINDEARLSTALRRGFDLCSEFPVRWVIHHEVKFQGEIENKYRLFAVGHHISVDGFSLSVLSKEILRFLEPPTEQPASKQSGLPYGEYVQRQVRKIRRSTCQSTYTQFLGCLLEKRQRTSCKGFLDVTNRAHGSFLVARSRSYQAHGPLPPHAYMGIFPQRRTAEVE